jgi:hypothetical protein
MSLGPVVRRVGELAELAGDEVGGLLADVDRAVADALDHPCHHDHSEAPLAKRGRRHHINEPLDEATVPRDVKLGETLSEDDRLLLVAVALVELDRAEIATKVRVRDDQLGTVLVRPFFYGFQKAAADAVAAVFGLNGEPIEIDTPSANIELRLDGRVFGRPVKLRLCVTNRLAVYFRDEPDRVLGQRLLERAPVPLDLGFVVGDMKPLGFRLGVLLSQIPSHASKTLSILGFRGPHFDTHPAIVAPRAFHIKPLAAVRS